MEQKKVIVIGAGNRGQTYTNIMAEMPDKYKVVGVAEPIDNRRNYIKEKHGCDEEHCFTTWEHILDIPKFADIAIISTMDQLHFAPAMKALELGYDLLLEKPVAPTPEECGQIYKQAQKYGRKVMVCHVLRYTPFFMQLKEIVDSDVLGKVTSIEHTEAVGNIHQSHSFVRGNWGNSGRATFMLLQKCCHDVDILQWLIGEKCSKLSSFGSLSYFTEDNAPEGAPERCLEGCPIYDTCPYNSVKLYYDDKDNGWFRTTSTKKVSPTDEDVMEALKTTQYGKCVFRCDNDVVDHQVVNMEFANKTTLNMTMCAFTKGGRFTHLMGTKGELWAEMRSDDGKQFKFYDFATKDFRYIDSEIAVSGDSITSGHGGGDHGIIVALYDYLTDKLSADEVSEIGISCYNHMLVFAAEDSRINGTMINAKEYTEKYML
ncbi:MAG: Gfo/Idh/MocA family oxidoreductase [Acutalibacteraceae bacterium]|nr:Gfo/Idh/MocA family oxidoreductase [Acutalibacteraceae bacterium]